MAKRQVKVKVKAKSRRQAKSRRTLEVAECADEIGLPLELLRDYAMRGCPHDKGGRGRSNRFDVAEVVGWMREHNLTGRPGRPIDTPDSPDLERARLRKENALASKYELQVKRDKAELVPIEDVKQRWGERVATAKNKLVGLGAGVTPLLEGRDTAERQAIIDDRVTEILTELAAP